MGVHFSFMWLKQCILIATRISKSFNVLFKRHSDQFHCVIRLSLSGTEVFRLVVIGWDGELVHV